eukprot:7492746-Heterocapsa_arctica.AAC.1
MERCVACDLPPPKAHLELSCCSALMVRWPTPECAGRQNRAGADCSRSRGRRGRCDPDCARVCRVHLIGRGLWKTLG